MALDKLPGEHGDSLDYGMINTFLVTFGIGIVIGICFFAFAL